MAQVRLLPPEVAARGLPVRVQGVVTYRDDGWGHIFLQDATAGIFVAEVGTNLTFEFGDRIELVGTTQPGHFAPVIQHQKHQPLGPGELPPAIRAAWAQLLSGSHDSQWVEVEGVIRAVHLDERHLRLKIASGGVVFDARIPWMSDRPVPPQLVNSRVRLRGACGTVFNSRRQAVGMQMFVPNLQQIEIIRREASDPFTREAQAIAALLRFNPQVEAEPRVKVEGTVTLRLKDGSFVVQDKSGGVLVRPATADLVQEGFRVEVVGFPVVANHSPELVDAQFRLGPPAAWPVPARVDVDALMSGDFDGQRVEIEGELADLAHTGSQLRLALRTAKGLLEAVLDRAGTEPVKWVPGSRLRVAGVCLVLADEQKHPRSVVLGIRDPRDITVLASPSWWTARRAWQALALLAGAGLLALGYMALLRRQVSRQTDIIRRQMNQVSQLETRYRLFLENSGGIYYQMDSRHPQPVFFHGQLEKITGYPAAEFNNHARLWRDLVHPEDREQVEGESNKLLQQPGYVAVQEYRILRRDGRSCWVQDIARNNPAFDGSIQAIYGAIYDITPRKRAEEEHARLEEQLRQSQKMEAIGQLAAGVAHDFNNILTVIQGNASLLEEDLRNRPDLQDAVKEITEATLRAAGLTRKLLLFSRKQAVQPQPVNMNELVGNLTKILGRLIGEHIHLHFNYAPGLPLVLADPSMLEQTILNLAVNARDAMPNGGSLAFSTEQAEWAEADLAGHPERREGRFVCLAVADTGCGMTPEVLQHIFEPFFTTKEPGRGTGLGLATVYGVIKQHRGWVEVSSKPGQGTTFRLFLPVHLEPVEKPAAEPTAVAVPAGGGERLLLVEDEAPVRMLVAAALQRKGYQITMAASGVEALRLWDEAGGQFDLLLTDMVMPHGVTGFELGKRLRARQPDLKIIYMSGYSAESVLAEAAQDVRTRFLPKPYAIGTLLQLIRDVLDGRYPEKARLPAASVLL